MDIIEMVLVGAVGFFALVAIISGALWAWHVDERRRYYGERRWKRRK